MPIEHAHEPEDARPKDPAAAPPEKPVTEEGLAASSDELGKQYLTDATQQGNFESSPDDPSGPIEGELTVFEPGEPAEEGELQADELSTNGEEAGDEADEDGARGATKGDEARPSRRRARRRSP